MKKKFLFVAMTVLFVLGISAGTLYAVAPKELFNLNASQLESRVPSSSLTYIETNYPNAKIMNVDLELFGYEVYLDNGIIIDFNFNETVDWISRSYEGTIQNIDTITNQPSSNVNAVQITERNTLSEPLPESIETYLLTQYPNETVLLVEKDDDGYDVYLSNGIEIDYDFDGDIEVETDSEEDDDFDQDVVVPIEEVPASITSYLETNYPNETVLLVEQDDDGYDVYLSNGIEIDFDFNGDIEVETDSEDDDDDWNDWEDTIPVTDLPEVIINYISANYPGLNILKVEWDEGVYEVYLSNRLELTFSSSGQLLEIDAD